MKLVNNKPHNCQATNPTINITVDIILAIVPRIQDDFGYTPAGPALLKGSLQSHGFKAKVIDFNAQLEQAVTGSDLTALSNFFMNYNFYNKDVGQMALAQVDQWAQQIVAENPKWLGISVFSYNSQRAARLLSIRVKQLNSQIKIVIGGAGIITDFFFAEDLKESHLIDAYIRGEGELALIELLKGNELYPGINGIPFQQIDNIESIAFPNYDDYELVTYTNQRGLVALPITGSRGCVRKCTFCDVASQWPKYRFRSGKSIADEVKHQVNRYGVKGFRFTDSLINGSLRAFKDMVHELAEFRDTLPDHKKFYWDSHFIVRGSKEMPPEMFDIMSRSGASLMLMGVESGSQAVRDHMQKGFTQEQLDYCMQQFARTGIKVRFLMIVGYPTETEQDFQNTLDMFTQYQVYAQSGIIDEINLGLTLNLLPNTPLHANREQYGIVQENHINNWICKSNPSLTYKERLRRRIILQEHVETLGYRVFEKTNYTRQLFVAWSEVSKISPPVVINNFHYARDAGGLVASEPPVNFSNKKVLAIVPV